MLLVVGLGNPGRRYAGHRHNIGFMAVDEIHRRLRLPAWRARFEGEVAEGLIGGERVALLKPATYMNESGRSVGQAMRFYKIAPAEVLVIHDELDLDPGKVRVKRGGGHGGHNGLKSIDSHIGKDYRRLRIGIGHPGAKEMVNGYVLHEFAKADRDWVDPLLASLAENVPLLVHGDDAGFMNRLHLASADASRAASPPPARTASAAVPAAQRGVGGALADGLRKLLRRDG